MGSTVVVCLLVALSVSFEYSYKGELLREENERLRKGMENTSEPPGPLLQQGQSSESITNIICSSSDPDRGPGNSDTFLKLGLPLPN